jgi:hypothetical protein
LGKKLLDQVPIVTGVQGQAAPQVWNAVRGARNLHGANGSVFARDGYLHQSLGDAYDEPALNGDREPVNGVSLM